MSAYTKAIAAALFAAALSANTLLGGHWPPTHDEILTIVNAWLGVIAVYAFPNNPPMITPTIPKSPAQSSTSPS